MIYAINAVSVYLFFFAPIFVSVYAYLDAESQRLNFSVYLGKYFKIIGGYAVLDGKNVVFHITEKTALILDLTSIEMKGELENLKSIELIELKMTYLFPYSVNALVEATVLSTFLSVAIPLIKTKKDFAEIGESVVVGGVENIRVYFKTVIAFNLVSIIKIILAKIRRKNEKRK